MILEPLWPVWAIALALLPALACCMVLAVRRPTRRWAWARRTLLVLSLIAIALGPSVAARDGRVVQSNAELFFVVDRTGSMAAEDWNGSQPRLDGVRHDLVALTEAFPGARYSIIGWDSQATRQLPLTTDARAVRAWGDTLRQEVTRYSAGSQVDRPLAALTEALTGAAERNPANVRLVFFLSDGENTDGDSSSATAPLASFAALAPLVDGGAVLGYGTAEGGRMRVYDGSGTTGAGTDAPFITDPTQGDADAISRIDEVSLRTIAQDLGVTYVHRIGPDSVADLASGVNLNEIVSDGRGEVVVYRPVVWPIAIAALALLAWEAFALARAVPRRRAR